MPKKKRLYRAFLFALLGVLFLNALHAAFFYERGSKPFTLHYTVNSTYQTLVWHSIKPKFKEESYLTKKQTIKANEPTVIEIEINEPQGVQILGLYWSSAHKGSFGISNASISSKDKQFQYQNASQLVAYSSSNLDTQISEESIIAVSSDKANGWFILNTVEMEEMAKQKLFSPFAWFISLILFVGLFFLKFSRRIPKGNWIQGSYFEKIRAYTLLTWAFLLPFWSQVSHVFLGITMALFLWGLLTKKVRVERKQLVPFIALWGLFFCLLFIDVIFHIESLGKDFENYIYFVLTPFVFMGLSRKLLKTLMKVFQVAITIYIITLTLSITVRYFEYQATESFKGVFFAITEWYWHTSYLAGFIIIAHLFALRNHTKWLWSMVFIPFILGFFYLTEARLPALMYFGLSVILFIGRFPNKRFRNVSFGVLAMLGVVISGYLVLNKENQHKLAKEVLHTKTNKMDVRLTLWDTSIDLIKEQPLTGIGRKNIRKELTKSIPQETKIKFRNYNVHNQYLEWWLGYGLLAVLVFIVVLLYPLFFRSGNYWWFIVYFGIAILVETYLARQAGVIFFSFWYSFFIIYDFSNARIGDKRD